MSEYVALLKQLDFHYLYPVSKRWFLFLPAVICPLSFLYDAPFGRFATPSSLLAVDGITSWIFMELISPLAFGVTLWLHPFSPHAIPLPSLSRPQITPQLLLTSLFFVHYLNRALISPLRTPSRSKSHLSVVLSAIVFNTVNGFLLSAYLSSARLGAILVNAYSSPRFWLGIALWAAGFAGNIAHDEMLLNLRRKAKAKGKAREAAGQSAGEHYAIPHGGLYRLVSYPNYLCEWIEWAGFALAAGPAPDWQLLPAVAPVLTALTSGALGEVGQLFTPFADSVMPPWAFFFGEVFLMIPRAVRGHQWYHQRFGTSYPSERRAIIPWLL
ncbi:hypothetical protein FA95DRAFT_1603655 [Auriscalpium vulgare]|uniref:Uncharacterized protein n=1 Tax=Auriscalpium vulgare TaxID=40419 RepID=A0ACB8S2L1_9AGAM|nr:hypothetical protein FA95DRAFT_1603655 [Auriscalpium vulgare]